MAIGRQFVIGTVGGMRVDEYATHAEDVEYMERQHGMTG